MYDPTEWVGNFWFGYVVRHCRADYMRGSPVAERLNPLRYEVGFGRRRPCRVVWNRKAWMQRAWSDLNWRLWKRRLHQPRSGPPTPMDRSNYETGWNDGYAEGYGCKLHDATEPFAPKAAQLPDRIELAADLIQRRYKRDFGSDRPGAIGLARSIAKVLTEADSTS